MAASSNAADPSSPLRSIINYHAEQLIESGKAISARSEAVAAAVAREMDSPARELLAGKVITAFLANPLQLLLIGEDDAVPVSLHAALERAAMEVLPHHISRTPRGAEILDRLLGRRTLPELAEALVELGVWEEMDTEFIAKISKFRSKVAHLNYELIEKALVSHSEHTRLRARRDLQDIDATQDFVTAVKLFVKLGMSLVGRE
jgi:hypothetical protein